MMPALFLMPALMLVAVHAWLVQYMHVGQVIECATSRSDYTFACMIDFCQILALHSTQVAPVMLLRKMKLTASIVIAD